MGTAEEYAEKQLQEIKHCRLAMLGLASKASDTDIGVLQQLGILSLHPSSLPERASISQRASRRPPLPLLHHLSLPVSASPPFRRLCRGVRLVEGRLFLLALAWQGWL